jgi:hypothetical protein
MNHSTTRQADKDIPSIIRRGSIFHFSILSIVTSATIFPRLFFCSSLVHTPHPQLDYLLPKNFVALRTPKLAATITPREY